MLKIHQIVKPFSFHSNFNKHFSMTKKTIILLGFIALKFLLQFLLLSSEYDLQRDEYLHLDQANHLAWGYLSVPPFTSGHLILFNYSAIQFFGSSFSPPCMEH
jgi:hypothetical protein